MAKIVAEDRPFTRYELSQSDGWRNSIRGASSKSTTRNAFDAGSSSLSWYATETPGEHWEDLCRGPHLPSTGRIGPFKLMSLASSDKHGDANSDRLTRVYGTASSAKNNFKHLEAREEAKARDHRVLGKKLGLFHLTNVGSGWCCGRPMERHFAKPSRISFQRNWTGKARQVLTLHVGKLDLYRTSGHFPYYRESQFPRWSTTI